MMKQKVIKTGNSLAVTVPAAFTQVIGVKAGDSVEVSADMKNCQINYRFSGVQQLPLNDDFLKKKRKAKS
ncbi:AbrB/MazE/SpoVT family DNA-binding domain-containing protein [Patescibacteria group bacterium]|nr:AbrB/MazE/SpoVT family DNA-binding domain-containing protein [Patescibacteria group bacterium]